MNEWATILLATLAVIISFIGVVWKMSTDIRGEHKATNDAQSKSVARVYERFDDFKKEVGESHVSKEVFNLTYSALLNDLSEIKQDVKALLGKSSGQH